jgi:hypothetical protein
LGKVKSAKQYHKKSFDQMREDMEAVFRGYADKGWGKENYVANILHRHVHQRTAALYAKNPKCQATRRKRLDYKFWDGDEKTLAEAYKKMQDAVMEGLQPNPMDMQVVQDYESVQQGKKTLDKVAESLELLFTYYMDEQQPTFKSQMKSLVRRVITTSVGFVKVGYQREMDRLPEVSAKMSDVQAQVDHLRRLTQEAKKGDITDVDAQMEELLLSMESLQKEPLVTIQEGLVFDFPECDSIIVDPMCRQLRGFVGATWVAHELFLSPDEVKEIYDVDIQADYLQYDIKGKEMSTRSNFKYRTETYDGMNADNLREGLALVWEIYDKNAGLKYVVCDGYEDFLEEPDAPPVKLETFWPFFSLTFNEIEHKDHLYPPSDIKLLLPMHQPEC